MMAAVTAAEQGAAVTLLEPNERLGKKLNITGKGRCNVTNNAAREELLANTARNGRFLYSAFSRFDGRDAMTFFESLGVPLKTERGNRVFPVSDRSFDISGALERRLRRLGVEIVRDRAAAVALNADGAVEQVVGERGRYGSEAVILATGGVSYPATGSTGDGYRIAERFGHTLIQPVGSLVPLVSGDPCCPAMQGLALKNVAVTVRSQKKTVYRDFGELLFTHFGMSGPVILSASAHMRDFDRNRYTVDIDLKPALDDRKLEARLLRDMEERKNQNFTALVGGLVPHSMIPVMVERCGVDGETKVHSVTREQRRKLEETLRHFTVEVTGPRPVEEAIVTSGGISIKEINSTTMKSKIVKGLYFSGEILDVDAYTGGFNLQIAWATGRAAGLAAADTGENQ